MSVARIKDPMVERKPSVDENSKGLNEKIRMYYRHEESLMPLRIKLDGEFTIEEIEVNEQQYRTAKEGDLI